MEKFYLEMPSPERKEDILSYLHELDEYNSDTNGIGSLRRYFEGYTFEQALDMCLNMQNEEYAKKHGKCPSKTFLLIRENDDKVVGAINLRWNIPPEMLQFGGHIGYGIRPTERRKGYNKINFYLGLIEAKKLGLDRVMLDCDVNNIASDKTLKALGGVLERTEIDPYDGMLTNIYWFDVSECLEKYKNIYEPYLVENNEKYMKINI